MAKRYTLDGEIERLTRLTGRLGRRLEYNLRAPRSTGEPEATCLPGEEWRQVFAEYTSALRTLAHGHGERAKRRLLEQKVVQTPMTDEEFEREMRQLAAKSVMEASNADLETWLAGRAAARRYHAARAGVGQRKAGSVVASPAGVAAVGCHPRPATELDALHVDALRRGSCRDR